MHLRSLRMLVMSILTITVATQPIFLLAAAAEQTGPEFGFGAVGLGLFTTAFFITSAVTSTPAGRMVERIGWQAAIRTLAIASVACLLAIAGLARDSWSLGLLLVVAAAFYGLANPAANLALARFVRSGRRGTFFGIKHAGIPASTLLAGLAVPLINVRWGWRWAYVAAAGVGVLLFMLVPRRADDSDAGDVDDGRQRQMQPSDVRRLRAVAACVTAGPGALGVFTVAAGVAAGLTEANAGWTLSIAGLATVLARIGYGVTVDRIGSTGIRPFLTVVVAGSISLAVLAFSAGGWFSVMIVVTFITAWGWPGLLTYTVVEGNRARPAEATARTQAGIFIGAGLGPPVFGWLVDRVDFQGAWLAVAATLLIGVAIAMPLVRGERHDVRA